MAYSRMTTEKSVGTETNQGADVSRFGLFGDLPSRAMFLALRLSPRMPYFIEAGLLHFFSFIVLLLAHKQRRAIRRNLAVIWHDLSWAEGYLAAYRVFVNFVYQFPR